MARFWIAGILLAGSVALAQPTPPSFEELDADGSGALTADEIGAMFERFAGRGGGPGGANPRGDGGPGEGRGPGGGRGPNPEMILSRWDADGDGSVSKQEFDARPRFGGPGSGPRGGPRGGPPSVDL